MKERHILFSAEMVRAILAGRKTQTRRIINPQPGKYINELHGGELSKRAPYMMRDDNDNPCGMGFQDDNGNFWPCRYGISGDRLWVKETFAVVPWIGDGGRQTTKTLYRADNPGRNDWRPESGDKWKPSIFCTRKASRITLEIESVRVERLQDISEADAMAEGVSNYLNITNQATGEIDRDAVDAYEMLWKSINGDGSWAANPWVWVITFRRI